MSAQEYNTVRALKLHEIRNNPAYQALINRYANEHCTGQMRRFLISWVGGEVC